MTKVLIGRRDVKSKMRAQIEQSLAGLTFDGDTTAEDVLASYDASVDNYLLRGKNREKTPAKLLQDLAKIRDLVFWYYDIGCPV